MNAQREAVRIPLPCSEFHIGKSLIRRLRMVNRWQILLGKEK